MEINYKNVFISTVCIAALTGVGYALYFDHKRRNDVAFRKELKKKKKAVEKEETKVQSKNVQAATVESADRIAAIYNKILAEPVPQTMDEAEAYLFDNLNKGEVFASRGPEFFEEAATYIFRAVRACPNPVELVLLTEKMLPQQCYEIVINLFSFEIKAKQNEYLEYYNEYPPSDMNVKLVEVPGQSAIPSEPIKKYYLVADKDFSEGEVIYTESPVISTLFPSLEGNGFCSRCLIKIQNDAPTLKHAYLDSVYCSQACFKAVENEFPSEVPSNPEVGFKVFEDAKESKNMLPSLAARVLCRVFREHESGLAKRRADKYTCMQHVERFIGDDMKTSDERLEEETTLLQKYLGIQTESIEQVINLDYYKTIKGKILKGTFGIVSSPDDPLISACNIKDDIRFVTPYVPTGCGVYIVSSYLGSGIFDSNTQAEFRKKNHELTLVATKSIKKGEHLVVGTFNKPQAEEKKTITTEPTLDAAEFPPLSKETENIEVKKDTKDDDLPSYAEVVVQPTETQTTAEVVEKEIAAEESDKTLEVNEVVEEEGNEQDSMGSFSEIGQDTPPHELSLSQEGYEKLDSSDEQPQQS